MNCTVTFFIENENDANIKIQIILLLRRVYLLKNELSEWMVLASDIDFQVLTRFCRPQTEGP